MQNEVTENKINSVAENVDYESLKKNPALINMDLVNQISADFNDKLRVFSEAYQAYWDDARRKQNAVDAKASKAQERLNQIDAEKETIAQQLGDAYSVGDEIVVGELESQLDQLSVESFSLNQKINLLRQVKIKGDDNLFSNVSEAYNEQNISRGNHDFQLYKLRDIIKEHIADFESILRAIEWDLSSNMGPMVNASTLQDRQLIETEEFHNNIINVTGHNAGTDEEAKRRYVRGTMRGLENTPIYTDAQEG